MVKLKTKDEYSFAEAQLDIVSSATEACNAYSEALAAGADLLELDTVMSNIQFIKSTIEARGVEWYVTNCDPQGAFASMCAIQGKAKENWISATDAALENLISETWQKIKDFFQKIIDWFASFFDESKDTAAEQVVEEAKKEATEIKKEEAAAPEKKVAPSEVKVAPKKTSIVKRFIGFVTSFRKKSAPDPKEGDEYVGVIPLNSMPKYIQAVTELVDAWSEHIPEMQKCIEKFKAVKSKDDYDKALAEENTSKDKFAERLGKIAADFEELGKKMAKPSKGGEYVLTDLGVNSIDDAIKMINFADQLKAVCHGPKFKSVRNTAKNIAKICKDFSFSGDAETTQAISGHMVKISQDFSKTAGNFMDIQNQYNGYISQLVRQITSKYKQQMEAKK